MFKTKQNKAMKNFKLLTLAIGLILLAHSLVAQTTDSEYYLNILTPYFQSIPSSEIGGADFGPSINEGIYGELAYATDEENNFACEEANS